MALLSIRNLKMNYKSGDQRVKALNGINLDIEAGESLGIVGESGSGKTTLIMAIMRLLPKNSTEVSGEVYLEDKELLSMDDETLRKMRWEDMSLVFQKSMNALSPVHKTGAFMSDIYRSHRPETSRAEARKRIESLLELVNLSPNIYNLYPHELSGGMMQRISIALSLLFNPKLLILDEATTALDVVTQTQILDELIELERKLGITRIMITHDISIVASSCKNVAVLYAGCLMEVGPVEEVLVNPIHGYTRGLIESFPCFEEGERKPLKSIPGTLPDLTATMEGCAFSPRCSEACETCRTEGPVLWDYGNGHFAACHRAWRDQNGTA